MTLETIQKRYPKAFCHLNYAARHKRLGLLLGSGVSDSLGIPKWTDLINGLEKVLGYDAGKAPESYRAEQLFQFHKEKEKARLKLKDEEERAAAINAGWGKVAHTSLL